MNSSQASGTIFFAHRGPLQLYVRAAICQAHAANPHSEIVVLGDQPAGSLAPEIRNIVTYGNIRDYSAGADEFAKVFRADGPNSFSYELMNFQRWFFVESFLDRHSVEGPVLLLDSDSFLYITVNEVISKMQTGMSVVDEVGPQFTFFRSRKDVAEFKDFLLASFTFPEKYALLQNFVWKFRGEGLPNVVDMAALGYYAQQRKLDDFGKPHRLDFVFCENIGSSQGLQRGPIGKKITIRRGERYFTTHDGRRVRAGGIHLQGGNKLLWPFFVDAGVNRTLKNLHPHQFHAARREALSKGLTVGFLKLAARGRTMIESLTKGHSGGARR